MSAAAASSIDHSKIMCKYSAKECPFGVICRYNHGTRASKASKPNKAKDEVVRHKNAIMKARAGNTVGKHISAAMTAHREEKDRVLIQTLGKQSKDLALRRSALLKQKSDFDLKYVLVNDSKSATSSPFDDSIKLLDAELSAMRTFARSSFGQRPVSIPLIVVLSVSNTAANTNATFLTLDPSNSIDWPAIATIFDEVKTTHITAEYFPRTFTTASTPTAAGGESAAVFVYDPEDLVPLTGLPQGCSYAYHKKYMVAQSAVSAAVSTFSSLNTMHKLQIPVPKGDLITPPANTATSLCVGDAWVDTTGGAGTCDPVGTLKWYEKNGQNTALVVGTVIETFTCHFRMRF